MDLRNPKVNITKRVPIDGEYRFCPVVEAGNNRIKPDWVVIGAAGNNSREVKIEAGNYYLEWHQDGKRHRLSLGDTDAQEAYNRKLVKESELRSKRLGLKVEAVDEQRDGKRLGATIDNYLLQVANKKKKT